MTKKKKEKKKKAFVLIFFGEINGVFCLCSAISGKQIQPKKAEPMCAEWLEDPNKLVKSKERNITNGACLYKQSTKEGYFMLFS